MEVEGIEDASVLTGVYPLVNLDNVDTKLNLEEIEKQLIGTNVVPEEEPIDPSEAFKSMMKEFSKNIEADASTVGESFSMGDPFEDINPLEPPKSIVNDYSVTNKGWSPASTQSPAPSKPKPMFDPSTAEMKIGYPNPHEVPPPYSSMHITSYPHSAPYQHNPPPSYNRPKGDLEKMTEEQRDQRQIDYVLNKMDGGDTMSSSFEVEREKEEKIRMLDAIDAIRGEMKYEKIDISGIPPVTMENNISEIENSLKVLKYKYDRKRYSSLAEDVIMAGAYGAEYVFDGKRKFGPYSPDLTDWHETVRVKLRRMRYETSSIVSNIMNEYQIGPVWRILLELVPSAFLHSRVRSSRKDENIPTEEEMRKAMGAIRDFETDE